jgi:hypothetical protein
MCGSVNDGYRKTKLKGAMDADILNADLVMTTSEFGSLP